MRSVLCIDDDERSLFIRSKILERHGYRVLSAGCGEEGLRLFSSERIDAVVLDQFMPGMTGAEVAWELKRRGADVPVLMLSSAVFCPDTAADLVDAFCAKIDGPVAFLELLDKLVEHAQASGGPARRCILHVDDHENHRYTVSRLLRRAGFDVLEAATGEEGLQQALKMPDLVLLDVRLPDISGIEVCKTIKQRWPTTVVLQTSATFVTAGDRVRGLEGGADAYLVQPIDPDELVAAVRALLRLHQTEERLRLLNESLERRIDERTRELREANASLSEQIARRERA